MDTLVNKMMKKQGVDEKLKSCDQMAWVREVNKICNVAEENVFDELIYK